MDSLKYQYQNSEQIRKGIDTVLKSDRYTEDFKNTVRKHLELDRVDIFSPEGSLVVREGDSVNEIIISTRKGNSTGWVERAVYIDEELVKAVDTIVDELIPAPPKQRILTVPKSLYDDKIRELEDLYKQLRDRTAERDTALTEIESLKGEIQSLLQLLDASKLQAAAANNELEASEGRFRGILSNFQEALKKGIQEAIERVSLEAQVRGLQAQKEVLISQRTSLLDVVRTLQLQLEALGAQIQFQQQQIIQQAEEQAAQLVIQSPYSGRGTSGKTGWEVLNVQKPNDFQKGQVLRYEDNDGNRAWINGPDMVLYNIETEPMIFTISFVVDNALGEFHPIPWISTSTGQTQYEVPPRNGSTPGQTVVRFRFANQVGSGNNNDYKDRVTIQASNGDIFTLQANYFYDR